MSLAVWRLLLPNENGGKMSNPVFFACTHFGSKISTIFKWMRNLYDG